MRRSRAVAGWLALGVALTFLTSCGSEEQSPGSGGLAVLEGTDTTTVSGTEVPVIVPNGSYVFTVSEPTTSLPDDVSDDGGSDDATYVGLAWRPEGTAPEAGPVLHGTDPEPAPVRISQGDTTGEVTELGADTTGGNANGVVWVSVDPDADLTLEVEYDGLVQTFDLASGERQPGPADAFYDDTGTVRVDCPDGTSEADQGFDYTITCDLADVAAVPYVAGQGWAADGETWLVLDLSLTPSAFTWSGAGGTSDYEVTSQSGSVSVGDTEATVLSEDDPLGDGWSASLAVPAPAAEAVTLDVRRTYDLARDSGSGGPDSHQAVFEASIDLPPSTS